MVNSIIHRVLGYRRRAIERFMSQPIEVQAQQLSLLMSNDNGYLRQFGEFKSYEEFSSRVPIVEYEGLSPYIERVRRGERGVLWRGDDARWAAKSSGTTASVSKYIPINGRYLNNCHYRGGRDTVVTMLENYPKTKALSGRSLTLGGSAILEKEGGLIVGDLSAILIKNTPAPTSWIREPKASVALISDFEQKIEAICKATVGKNITSFAGVPSWNLVLMQKVLEYSGKSSINEVWKDMCMFIHGGIAFSPYRQEYEKIFTSPDMRYIETYNASEGFFALQNDPTDTAMLLMLDYEIFYEFIPLATLDDHTTAVPLEGVQTGVNYAMIISTSCGLWRYMIGDTVEFTSVLPYKIRITGRTKSFINAFGEEIIVDNANRAIAKACEVTASVVKEYTAAPIFMEGREKGAHEWIVESDLDEVHHTLFAESLDSALQSVNSDYAAKRHNCSTLNAPTVHFVPDGTFAEWMRTRGKVGGQNKVPRLAGSREYVESILNILKK